MLDDSVSVSRVGESEIEDLGVGHRLLEAVPGQLVVGLRFDDRDWEVRLVGEEIVRLLARTAAVLPANRNDAAVGELLLFADLVVRPARLVEFWQDIPPAGIGFVRQTEISVERPLRDSGRRGRSGLALHRPRRMHQAECPGRTLSFADG